MKATLFILGSIVAAVDAMLEVQPRSGTTYVLRNDDLQRQRLRLLAPSDRAIRNPRVLIDREVEPRFYAEPVLSRRRRRRLRGKAKALARASA